MQLSLAETSHSLDLRTLPRADIAGLYVHIPFCFHKCHYCDFYSITRQTPERMTRFVDLLLREAAMWAEATPDVKPRTIFFGGGTPSLLPLDQMQRLIESLRNRFDFSLIDEFTVEVNPATASAEYCAMLRAADVDRISFGAQSFNTTELKALERHHDPDDVPRSVELARAAGFSRLNVDLIYAIPGQSLESWQTTLDAAIALNTSHVSAYGLTYELNTPLAVKKRLGQLQPAEECLELEMMRLARDRLSEVGLMPYEISNFARENEPCRHNLHYWTGGSYAGLGPSAASHVAGTRFKNRPHLGEWERAIESDQLPAIEVELLPPERRADELVMLLLRLTPGLNYSDYAARTGFDARDRYAEQIDHLAKLKLISGDETGFRLTDAGLTVADSVAGEFIIAD